MEYHTIHSIEELEKSIQQQEAVLIYFSAPFCNVCKVLKPKVAEMISNTYPKIKMYYVDIEKSPVISGQYRIFSIPTLLVYFDGKEYIRRSRNIGINELRDEVERPYSLMFGD